VPSFAVPMMTAAALGDRFGRSCLFAAGLGLFAPASVACAAAPDAGSLIAARAAQGARGGADHAAGAGAVERCVPPAARPRTIGSSPGSSG
jgi:MFS family permease